MPERSATATKPVTDLNWPLMENNIPRADLDAVIEFLKGEPILTQSAQVRAFEEEWSAWVGVKHSVYLNSGSSANYLTLAALKYLNGVGEVIVPTLTWVSDIAAVLQAGFTPVFVDIHPDTLCMDEDQVVAKLNQRTKAVFLTYVQGFNGLSDRLLEALKREGVPLIEDVCESHGASFKGRRLGSFGWASNFSFYYAHHLSTIEGGMVCTNDSQLHEVLRMGRSHGMVREVRDEALRRELIARNPQCNPEFIFAFPAWNFRNNEIDAVIGRQQLKRLDANIEKRNRSHRLFLSRLDAKKYKTDFRLEGSSNYALNLVLRRADPDFCARVMDTLKACRVEFRRGSAGGGNQLRQPYLKGVVPEFEHLKYPHVEHIHYYGFYIGNYPDLPEERITALCEILNAIR